MKTLSITYTKNHFSALIREVQHGASILVCDYGKPVARLESVMMGDRGVSDGALEELEKRCLIRRPRRMLNQEFLEEAPIKTSDGSSVVEALLRERDSGL